MRTKFFIAVSIVAALTAGASMAIERSTPASSYETAAKQGQSNQQRRDAHGTAPIISTAPNLEGAAHVVKRAGDSLT